jgi:hypothetical protein
LVVAAPIANAFAAAILAGDVTTGSGGHVYRVEHDWLTPPAGLAWGDTHGVAQDKAGNIYISHTVGGEATKDDAVYVFTKDGAFVRSMLPQMKGGGHGLDVRDEGGVEFLYHCDVNRRRVLKTTLDGKVLWERGAPVEAEFAGAKIYGGENDWNPTNVAFHPNGDVFVGDGYGKSFVHIYSKDGAFKSTIAGPGSGEGQVSCPHGLWWDDRVNRLAVADRSNNRIQYFAESGANQPWKHVSFVKDSMRQGCAEGLHSRQVRASTLRDLPCGWLDPRGRMGADRSGDQTDARLTSPRVPASPLWERGHAPTTTPPVPSDTGGVRSWARAASPGSVALKR